MLDNARQQGYENFLDRTDTQNDDSFPALHAQDVPANTNEIADSGILFATLLPILSKPIEKLQRQCIESAHSMKQTPTPRQQDVL